jgi:hypothetical protein
MPNFRRSKAEAIAGLPEWLRRPEAELVEPEVLEQDEPGAVEPDAPELAQEQLVGADNFQTPQAPAGEVNNATAPQRFEAPETANWQIPNKPAEAPRSRYVPTAAADQMVKGREAEVVRGVGIPWHGRDHIRCPYGTHPDNNPSWRLTEQGKAICTCRSAHSVFDVVMATEGVDFDTAKLRAAEILGRQDAIVEPGESSKGVNLAQLAEAKGLPVAFMQEHGCFDLRRHGKYHTAAVGMTYRAATGGKTWLRIRTELSGNSKKKFRWKTGDKEAPLFGAHMAHALPAAGYVVLVEGETCALTCWYHGIAALGLPGAGTWNEERHASLLDGVETIYVIVEPDSGGAATLRWLARSSIAPRTRLVHMPAATKDPSSLYLAVGENFKTAWQALLDAAEPFDAQKHAPPATPEMAAPPSGKGISYDDFWSYLPQHNYFFEPTGAFWPGSSVDSQLPWVPAAN